MTRIAGMKTWVQTNAKALVAAVVAGLGSLKAAVAENGVSAEEGIEVAIVTLVALGGVWAVPNLISDVRARAALAKNREQ